MRLRFMMILAILATTSGANLTGCQLGHVEGETVASGMDNAPPSDPNSASPQTPQSSTGPSTPTPSNPAVPNSPQPQPQPQPQPDPGSSTPQIGDVIDGKWKLVWSDEFDQGDRPDPSNWDYEHGFVRNRELQYYQPDNATVKNGLLVIEARRETTPRPESGNAAYTSASLITKGKHEFTYGRFEARMRIDPRLGSWPAFWTLGTNVGSVGWPGCGEIDIMEYYTGKVLANVCSPNNGSCAWSSVIKPLSQLGGETWPKEFHLWAMEWDNQRIDLFLDGQRVNHFEVASADQPGGANPFRKPHYLILNQAIGGTNGGDPGGTTFPVLLEVDYVRVYEAVP